MLACTDSVGLDGIVTVAGLFHSAVKQYVTKRYAYDYQRFRNALALWNKGLDAKTSDAA